MRQDELRSLDTAYVVLVAICEDVRCECHLAGPLCRVTDVRFCKATNAPALAGGIQFSTELDALTLQADV